MPRPGAVTAAVAAPWSWNTSASVTAGVVTGRTIPPTSTSPWASTASGSVTGKLTAPWSAQTSLTVAAGSRDREADRALRLERPPRGWPPGR